MDGRYESAAMSHHLPTLLHVYPTFELGGAQRRFIQLANHFGRDYRHVIVSLNGGAGAFKMLRDDLDARMIAIPHPKEDTWRSVGIFRNVLRELRPDLLVTSNWGSIEWAIANFDGRIPHLHMEDGFGPEEATRQLPRRVWTRRLLLRRSTVMLPSMTLYRIASEIWRIPARCLVHVPNGIDCARFTPEADPDFANSLGIADGEPVIGTVAVLRAEKNLRRLLDAFALVLPQRRARLVIVGDGPERTALELYAAERGIAEQVTFTGACAAPERILPSFDIFSLSSDTEQMPISLLEAMAAGCAAAATDVGDVRRILAEENHPFVVPKDPERLAQSLLRLLESPETRRIAGAANARRARQVFGQETMFAAYRKLYTGRPMN